MISPSVITSRAASQDFSQIQAKHADLIQGLSLQADKVAARNQQKAAELANQNAINMEAEKERRTATSEAQKTALTFSQKQADLDIKRASLSSI